MDDYDSPYRPPAPEPKPEVPSGRPSFREALARGFLATNETLGAVFLLFLLVAPEQILSGIMTAMMTQESLEFQPGNRLPPQFVSLVAVVGTACFWLVVMAFAYPWVIAGAIGQLRDRIAVTAEPVGAFRRYARRFYGRMLVIFLAFLAFLAVSYVPVFLVASTMASSKQRGFEQSQADFMRELSLDPVNVATTVVFNLAVLAGALVVSLSGAAVAVEDRGAIKAMGGALAFCRNNIGDATKLFLVNVCVVLPQIAIDRVATLLTVTSTSGLIALGTVTSILLAYTAVLSFGFAISLYVARRPLSESAP